MTSKEKVEQLDCLEIGGCVPDDEPPTNTASLFFCLAAVLSGHFAFPAPGNNADGTEPGRKERECSRNGSAQTVGCLVVDGKVGSAGLGRGQPLDLAKRTSAQASKAAHCT